MTVRTPDSGFESLERRYESVGRIAPYLLLAVPLVPYLLSERPDSGAFLITLGLVALAAAWLTWMIVLNPSWTRGRWLVVVYFVGLIGLAWLLTARSPWFAFFTWIGFLHAFEYLPGVWRWLAAASVALPFAVAQAGGFHRPTIESVVLLVVLACVDMGLIGVFVMLGQKTEQQNQARKKMIVELAQANQRLEEIMAENTGLQAQLLTQAREAGAADERQRMAREIHDTLAQGLTGIITQLEAAQQSSHDAERERQRLAEVYAAKADEELRSLAEEGGSLTDVARTALRHELDRRGIRHSVRESSPPPQEVEFPSVLTLRQFLTVQEAVMAKSILDSAGIESFLADENVISMNWLWSNALGGVKLQVRKTDVAVASELLEQTLSEAAASADSDETAKE